MPKFGMVGDNQILEAMMQQLVEIDKRHRTSLGKLGHPGRYLATELEGGVIVLEPAAVVTADQVWLDSRPDVQDALRESLDETTLVRRGHPRRASNA